jgi:hypothetical protein
MGVDVTQFHITPNQIYIFDLPFGFCFCLLGICFAIWALFSFYFWLGHLGPLLFYWGERLFFFSFFLKRARDGEAMTLNQQGLLNNKYYLL